MLKYLLFLLGLCHLAVAQQLRGRVTEESTDVPVVGAAVSLGDGQLITTNEAGFFVFRKPPQAPFELKVSAIGYTALTLKIQPGDGDKILKISITRGEVRLQEVEVRTTSPKTTPCD